MSNRSDTFDRANNPTSPGTPSDGLSAWVVKAGTWGITSNTAYEPGGVSPSYMTLECNSTDVTLQVTLATVASANCGFCFRLQDASNLMRADYNNAAGKFRVLSITGGVGTLILDAVGTIAATDVLSLTVSGTSIVFKKNGTPVVTTSSSLYQGNTLHGLYDGNSPTLTYDNFSITDLATGPTTDQIMPAWAMENVHSAMIGRRMI